MKQQLPAKSLLTALLLFLISLGASAQFTINVTPTPAQCAGMGMLTFNVATGQDAAATLSYTVYNSSGGVLTTIASPPYVVANLGVGIYSVQATQVINGTTTLSNVVSATIESTTAIPVYTPVITGARCGNNGQVIINTTSGIASQFSLYTGDDSTLLAGPQALNTFTSLAIGNYIVRVTDVCGNLQRITVPIVQENTFLTIHPHSRGMNSQLNSCSTIVLERQITYTSLPSFPLTLTYTVTSPQGVVTIVNQQLENHQMDGFPVTSPPLPFYAGEEYHYDLTITDACDNTFTRTNNIINESFTVNVIPDYGHCDESIIIRAENFVPPFTVNFISAPAGFEPVNHNPSHPSILSSNDLNYNNHLPAGSYCLQVTDSCGHTALGCVEIENIPQYISLDGEIACGATTGSLVVTFERSPGHTNFTQAHIIPPYPPGSGFTNETFIDISSGINPLAPHMLTWSGLAAGTYTVEAVSECGDMFILTETLNQNPPAEIYSLNRPGCSVGRGSVQISVGFPPLDHTPIVSARIMQGPPEWMAVNTVPFTVDAYISSIGVLYMSDLPEGDYIFEITDNCIPRELTVTVTGYHYTRRAATVSKDCVTYTITIDVAGANASGNPSYWLQKWDAVLNSWVHPVTGVAYIEGGFLSGNYGNITAGANDNAVRLTAPSLNAQGVLVPGISTGSGNGQYRIIESIVTYGNGTASLRCNTELTTFIYTGAPIIESVVSPCDSSNGEAIVTAEVVTNISFPEALYSVTGMEGNANFVTLGPQTSNRFTGLLPNVNYTFTVQDACNTTNFVTLLSLRQTPAAPAGAVTQVVNTTPGTNATIADIIVTGTNVRWYTTEADALSNSNPLPLTTIINSGTTYYATQSVTGCTSQTALPVTVTVALGIKDVAKNELKYYPNPVIDELMLESDEIISNVTIYDMHGRLVFEKILGTNRGTLNMQALQTGSYLVKVMAGSTIKNVMVIKI